jgi:lipopolysaccharide biosynthesis regulator YciM
LVENGGFKLNAKDYYSPEELSNIFELGRMYFESGFFAPAERIFNGLLSIDAGSTPSRLGLGLVKLELGLFNEAATLFRQCLDAGEFEMRAKVGLACCFLASRENSRAETLLREVRRAEKDGLVSFVAEEQRLLEALVLRARSD